MELNRLISSTQNLVKSSHEAPYQVPSPAWLVYQCYHEFQQVFFNLTKLNGDLADSIQGLHMVAVHKTYRIPWSMTCSVASIFLFGAA